MSRRGPWMNLGLDTTLDHNKHHGQMYKYVENYMRAGGKRKQNYFIDLAGDHLYGKLLFTWLSLVMSMMVSFCAVLFPTRCLG